MEAASCLESAGACRGRNFNGTFMIRRRAERRSDTGMVFLLDPGGSQVEIRQGRKQFYEDGPTGSSLFFHFRAMVLGDKCRQFSIKRGEGLWGHGLGVRADRDAPTIRAKHRGLCRTKRR